MSAAPAAIALDRITKTYAGTHAVNDLSLEIGTGEFFTILGPSGSGKTTTLSMIAGFVMADGGRILLNGKEMTQEPPQARGLGMVFQNYALFPHLNVFENIAFPLRVRRFADKEVKTRVLEVLSMMSLIGFETRLIRQLSGGQQQRVALARALVFAPSVVLMDEPLGALDKNLRYQMQNEIKELQRKLGTTIVYVTHDQEEAMNMSDRIAIMDKGKVAQVGPPREVYENPRTAFLAKFLGEANLVPAKLRAGAVETPMGAFPVPGAPAGGEGEGFFFIRPERLVVAREPSGEVHAKGSIRAISFLGNVVRYRVALGEQEVTSEMTSGRGDLGLGLGDAVAVSWAPDDGRWLAE